MTTASTPFPLGVYVGDPNNADAGAEATFESAFSNFVSTMGATPTYFDTYVDQTQAVSSWVGNSAWAASSSADSADTSGTIPVIALPMWSTASGSMTADQQLQAFASGQYDSVLEQMVDQWAANGFKTQVWRPGWEMNISGPTGVGTDAASEAAWVSAFQHIYTVLHAEAAKDGVSLQVVWNPGVTNYTNAAATTSLYPGSNYVDAIGGDMYSDIYPFSDGTSPPTYHDWDTGGEDTSTAQFIADPVNRDHYWSYPAATEWSSDSSQGHSLSLTSLIQFAEAQGKPFALPEVGAGDSSAGTDVQDDAAFPAWLAQQLTAAQAAGEKIDFVDIWDSNAGGNYEFSNAADGKPLEAAAWAAAFGGKTTATTGTTTSTSSTTSSTTTTTPTTSSSTTTTTATGAPPTLIVGSGADVLALAISEDAWNGDAQFTVSVDGVQIGGTLTATALHVTGSTQAVDVLGNFGSGTHTVSVNFLNDAYGGSSATDRNLYVASSAYNGTAVANGSLALMSSGARTFTFVQPTSTDTLTLKMSEDAWNGDAQFTVTVNGQQVGGVNTVTASHAAGATQTFSFTGSWGSGAQNVGITFINDAWGGTAATDRNLYVNGASYDGTALPGTPVEQASNGTTTLQVPSPASPGLMTLNLAEDAYSGNAQFTVAVDGVQLGGAQQVTALHGNGASEAFSFEDSLAAGTHDIAVSFINDAWGGSATTDRNLYVTGIAYNGTALAGSTATMDSNGTYHFSLVVPTH